MTRKNGNEWSRICFWVTCLLIGFFSVFLFSACGISPETTLSEPETQSATVKCNKIEHASGTSCVPEKPQKIITLSLPTLANAIVLGLQPIGSTNHSDEEYIFPAYLGNEIEGVESLGGNAQPNIEKIRFLKPDLIFGWLMNNSGAYPLLSKIAPTLLYDWQGTATWREYFDFMAKVLGREELAQEAWNAYDARVTALKDSLGNRYTDKQISFVYFCCDGFGSQAPNSFLGSILEDVGLQRPESQAVTAQYGEIRFSEEDIPKADGEVLFVAAYFESDRAYLHKIMEKPLWRTLKAVQQNHVYLVDAEIWRGGNLIAANKVLDDLRKYLVDTP